jgi:alanyl-tRNA synthetase
MKGSDLKKLYLKFFESKEHAIIPSAPLVPENDPTVLFTTAGMHPLVPFLMGQAHPLGKRLADVQKCLRTQDIDEVGDSTHTTFFEMLGNWSLGDYFKKETIEWSFEFLTSKEWLGLDIKRLAVTCFAGDKDAPKDVEASQIWSDLGMPEERIAFLDKAENWWGPAGETGPCGPDTEMFYWKLNNIPAPKTFDPEDGNWVEIWNDVFMQYEKKADGSFIPLKQQNVDTGLGVERVAMALQGKTNIFETEMFKPIIEKIDEITPQEFSKENLISFRIIADHMRAATFILGDVRDIIPSNVDQGYILRRYIRRCIRHLKLLDIDLFKIDATVEIAKLIIDLYKDDYPLLEKKKKFIFDELKKEEDKFQKTLEKGLREFAKVGDDEVVSGEEAFLLFQSYGFPIEMTQELADEKGIKVDVVGFNREYEKHRASSRKGAEQKFKGGLSGNDETTVKLHTATHILNQALRRVVNNDIVQKGSNITPERLRFDFNFDRALTPEEKVAVTNEVNRVVDEGIDIERLEMTPEEAIKMGAQAEFGARYPKIVSVYKMGDYSIEICMGPHVKNTKELGHFKIKKEQSSSAGVRRIKAILE